MDLSDTIQDPNNIKWSIFSQIVASGNQASVRRAWNVLPLNTDVVNQITDCSRTSNQITLPAGNYMVKLSQQFNQSGSQRVGIWNVTLGALTTVEGVNMYGYVTNSFGRKNVGAEGILELATTTVIEARYYSSASHVEGIGNRANTPDTYTIVSIGRLPS